MSSFVNYVAKTESILRRIIDGRLRPWKRAVVPILNGQPSEYLRQTESLNRLRRDGAFFTSSKIAQRAIDLDDVVSRTLIAADPACGSGDLLIAIARHLGPTGNLIETIDYWGQHLVGIDKSPTFIKLTKIRLALLALRLGASAVVPKSFDVTRFFPRIRTGDALTSADDLRRATVIALNPPFFLTAAPSDCAWATGRITAAAQFMEYALLNATDGTKVIGILPEVLRTGSMYGRWRELVENNVRAGAIRHLGIFDNHADVHVFVLTAIKAAGRKRKVIVWWRNRNKAARRVGNLFEVNVGAVVPHRHRKKGPVRAYLHARSASPWQRLSLIEETRRFTGTTFDSPFVVVRRTSRPEDKHRAVATLVTAGDNIAIENHLIVCRPRSGTIQDCKRLLQQLKRQGTTSFLNERMRCRHLTVSAVREIPIEF